MRPRALALVVGLAAARAHAGALDTFGLSARSEGLAGAAVADVRGWAAAHHNPAGLALVDEVQAAIGYGGAVSRLRLDGKDARLPAIRGTTLGLALPLAFRRFTLALGVALYLPDPLLAGITLGPSGEPRFVLLGDDLAHFQADVALALRLGRHVALGAGATLLTDLGGRALDLSADASAGGLAASAALDVQLPLSAAPILGLELTLASWLRLGLSWRGALDLHLQLDLRARAGDAITELALRTAALSSPHRVALGAAVDARPDLTLSVELDWLGWSRLDDGLPDLRALEPGQMQPLTSLAAPPALRDVWVPRLGLEWRRALAPAVGLGVRLGYAYEPTPVPSQLGLLAVADNDRHLLALGAGLELRQLTAILPKPLRLDLALQVHQLAARTTTRERALDGPAFRSEGTLLHLVATLESRF